MTARNAPSVWPIVITALTLLALVALAVIKPERPRPSTQQLPPHKYPVVPQYINAYTRETDWWLTTSSSVETSVASAREWHKKAEAALGSCRGTSAEIDRRLSGFLPLGLSIASPNGEVKILDNKGGKAKFYVCFFPKEMKDSSPSTMYFDHVHGKRAFVAGLNWPDKPFAAFIAHEIIAHAYNLRGQKLDPSNYPTEKRVAEEVSAHTLEGTVLNHLTDGQYFARIDRYLDKINLPTGEQVLVQLDLETLKDFDRLLEAEACHLGGASLLVDQYLLDIAFRSIDRSQMTDQEKQAQKAMAYESL
jgi:hypothetical protein